MRKFDRGFTLIELLAVITIAGIIMIVGIPAVMKIIENSREEVFEKSVGGIERAALLETKSNAVDGEELLYKYSDGSWEGLDLEIDGELPKYVEIKVKEENKVRYAITDGVYCATKDYDGEMTIKKIGNKNTDNAVEEKYCELDAVIPTADSCFNYSETNGIITITSYKCKKGNTQGNEEITKLVIPEEINGKTVTKIGAYAFSNSSLISVVLPESVTSIGTEAFKGNQINQVVMTNNVKGIGDRAFSNNQLESVEIPNSISSLGIGVFSGNKLKSIVISDNITHINSSAFSNNQLESVIFGKNVKFIGDDAFSSNRLTSIDFPDSLTSIGYIAFSNNKLASVVIPKNVKSIGASAFRGNSLTNVIILGKTSTADFTGGFGTDVFGWKSDSGCSDVTCIMFVS